MTEIPESILIPETTYGPERLKTVIGHEMIRCSCGSNLYRLWFESDGTWPNMVDACRSCGLAEFGIMQVPIGITIRQVQADDS
jgi:hypothetical protein